VVSEVAAYLDVGIELFDQGGVGSGHDGVGIGDDEDLGPGQVGLEGQPDGLRAVAGVDVAPQVPLPRSRIVVERWKAREVGGLHHV
jgi:hypothetical protein